MTNTLRQIENEKEADRRISEIGGSLILSDVEATRKVLLEVLEERNRARRKSTRVSKLTKAYRMVVDDPTIVGASR